MNDEQLKALFDQTKTTVDPKEKAKALAAAMQAFDEGLGETLGESCEPADTGGAVDNTHTIEKNSAADQGSAQVHRLTPNTHTVGSNKMHNKSPSKFSSRWLYGGLSSAALLVVAVSLSLQTLDTAELDSTSRKPAVTTKHSGDSLKELEKLAANNSQSVVKPAEKNVPSFALEEIVVTETKRDSSQQRSQLYASPSAKQMLGDSLAIADRLPPQGYQAAGRDKFETTESNSVKRVTEAPVSTFSIDVDTSAYSFVRRQLNQGVLPQKAAVRVEEMINYFTYDYPLPSTSDQPFSTSLTVIDSPWQAGNKLVHIGIQGYQLAGQQPRSNLVFLLDVSGSMNSADKLPLVKQSMSLLLSQLQPEDTVSIVVYAGAAGTVLEPTTVKNKQKIMAAMNQLSAGGSTAGADGIRLAYQLAESVFVKDGVNRIILATDGDFNVGISNKEELKGFVERKRKTGIYLSVLGFGQGNYNDQLMQTLAQNGNGIAAYIDTLSEAQKVLVDEATANLFTIANDVKIQLEFNPDTVAEYRLIGYETRALAEQDFNNDAVDAGDIGAGHSVTAIYEITPVGSDSGVYSTSRYQSVDKPVVKGEEYGFLKLRYKLPGQANSELISQPITVHGNDDKALIHEANFATAVAGFAQLLKGDQHIGQWRYQDALTMAQANKGEDFYGYRTELVQLIRKAMMAQAL